MSRAARSTRASRSSTRSPRTLRLDAVERAHLFRLADLPGAAAAAADCGDCPLPPEVQQVLDAIKFPACVLTERFDLIAWNEVYAALFPGITEAPPGERNTLLVNLTAPACCSPLQDQGTHCLALVGQLRAAYGRHVGDPAWTHFIRRLEAVSPAFAEAWASHDVAQPTSHTKHFRHPTVGHITTTSTSFAVTAVPGARLVVYTPDDEPSAKGTRPAGRGRGPRRPLPLLELPSSRTSRGLPRPPSSFALRVITAGYGCIRAPLTILSTAPRGPYTAIPTRSRLDRRTARTAARLSRSLPVANRSAVKTDMATPRLTARS